MAGSHESALWLAKNLGLSDASPLSPSEVAALGAVLEERDLPDGTRIFEAGEVPKGIWIVQNGAIELSSGEAGRKRVVWLVCSGEAVGDAQVLASEPAAFTARALGRCECLFLLADSFCQLLADCPGIAQRWLTVFSKRLCKAHERLLEVLGPSLARRVARLLLVESTDGRFPFSQSTMAKMLGAQRSSLNQVLKQFKEGRYIDMGYRCIDILDRGALKDFSEGRPIKR